jgi:hypothetical protein|tara:strand:+ start:2428 stop:3237 length:810 start_codon:yes stop_codon:yes gene_type:complete
MAKFAKGKYALAISDRSGLAFPWREMVTEWNGAFVHVSEYEPKQPQLEPKPFVADPQGLEQARPARTEFGTVDFLPKNPFTTAAASTLVTVSEPFSDRQNNDIVRFQEVKSPVGGVAVSTLELTTTLASNITATDLTISLTDASAFPTSGWFMIEKVQTSSDGSSYYENEVIRYTGKSSNDLTGCVRGTNAQFRGIVPNNTTARAHSAGAIIVGGYSITMIQTTVPQAGMPTTVTEENSYTFNLVSNAAASAIGGGFQVLAGPLNTQQG